MIKSLPIVGLVLLSVVRGFADDTNAAPRRKRSAGHKFAGSLPVAPPSLRDPGNK